MRCGGGLYASAPKCQDKFFKHLPKPAWRFCLTVLSLGRIVGREKESLGKVQSLRTIFAVLPSSRFLRAAAHR